MQLLQVVHNVLRRPWPKQIDTVKENHTQSEGETATCAKWVNFHSALSRLLYISECVFV